IENNVFFQTWTGIYLVRDLNVVSASSHVSVDHNTFVEGTTDEAVWDNSDGPAPPLFTTNNLLYGYTSWFRMRTVPSTAAGNLSVATSPFVDVAGGDMHLVSGASAIDASDATYSVPIDYEGRMRPIDGNGDGSAIADVGAYEFVP